MAQYLLNLPTLKLLVILLLTNPLMALSQEDKDIVDNQEQLTDNTNSKLPCLDTTNPCVEQLTQAAIATSLTLKTLNERITLIDDRLALIGDRKDYAESKLWTNYLPTTTNIDSIIDPFAWIRNLAGGGDMQRDRLAIADLEVKAATLEAARAELERRREQEKVNLQEKVLQLLLGYEAATRQVELVESQIKTFEVSREVFRIRYQFGEGTTEQWLSFQEREDRLNEQLVKVKTKQKETVRELKQLVGVN
jgi:hypothetical protein